MTASASAGEADQMGKHNTESNISADLPKGISPFDLPDKNDEDFKAMWEQEQGYGMSKDSDELLRVNYKLGHLSFAKIRFMVAVGWLDKRLGTCSIPKCAGCLYGKATRCPWRMKGEANQILKAGAGLHGSANGVHTRANQTNKWVLNTFKASLCHCVP